MFIGIHFYLIIFVIGPILFVITQIWQHCQYLVRQQSMVINAGIINELTSLNDPIISLNFKLEIRIHLKSFRNSIITEAAQ